MTEQNKPYRMTEGEIFIGWYHDGAVPELEGEDVREFMKSKEGKRSKEIADAAQDKLIEMGWKSPEECKRIVENHGEICYNEGLMEGKRLVKARLNSPEVVEMVAENIWTLYSQDVFKLSWKELLLEDGYSGRKLKERERTKAASLLAKIAEEMK